MVGISLECFVRQIPNPYKYKYTWMQKNADSVETLVLGNSHAFYAINPKYLSGVSFNLANPSQRLQNDLYLLKYWANNYKKLKTVIINISYFTWFTQGIEIAAPDCCRYYRLYMDCNMYSNYSFKDNFEISNPKLAVLKLKGFLFNKHTADGTCGKLGNAIMNTLSNKNIDDWNSGENNKMTIANHTISNRNQVNNNYSFMKEIVEFCKKRNVQLVLITTPCWYSYYENLDSKQLNDMYTLIHKFQKEYNILFLDYLKDRRFVAVDFYNESHLSNIGACKFTKILDMDINSSKIK